MADKTLLLIALAGLGVTVTILGLVWLLVRLSSRPNFNLDLRGLGVRVKISAD